MPATAENETESAKEAVMRRWRAHREAFRAAPFEAAGGGAGFLCLDRLVQPPRFALFAAWPGGRAAALEGDLRDDAAALADPAAIARDALGGGGGVVAGRPRAMEAGEALACLGLAGDRPGLAERSVRRFADSLADPRLSARLPAAQLAAAEAKRFEAAGLGRVRDCFHPGALAALGAAEGHRWRDYAFYAEPGEKGEARRQAAAQYPLLASWMAGLPSVRAAVDARAPLAEALQAAMGADEAGTPRLGKAAIKRLQGLAWPTGGLGVEGLVRAVSAFRKVEDPDRDLPPDWFPRGREDWDAFCDVAATVGTVLAEATRQGMGTLCQGCGGKWAEFRERLAKAYTDTRPPEGTLEEDEAYFRSAIDWPALAALPRDKVEAAALKVAEGLADPPGHVRREDVADWIVRLHAPDTSREALRGACVNAEDMVDAFARKVLLPLAAHESGLEDPYLSEVHMDAARPGAARVLVAGRAAHAVFEASRHFHSQYEQVMAAGADDESERERRARRERALMDAAAAALGVDHSRIPPEGWPPLSAIARAPNGVYLVALTDPELLAMEGHRGANPDGTEGLHHCVGGYASACRGGRHILSLRELTPDGGSFRRLSTAEINAVPHGGTRLDLRQHYGKHNRQPPERAQRAFEWYREQVACGAIPLNHDRIRGHLGALGARADEVMALCDYDWRERERIQKAVQPWGKYVAKPYKGMDLDRFARTPEVEAVRELFAPTFKPRAR